MDIGLSAHANARLWFQSRKKQQEKKTKTEAANESALRAAAVKTQQQLAKVQPELRYLATCHFLACAAGLNILITCNHWEDCIHW